MAIQIGKYKRPGIFTEEIDSSVFSSPTVDGITNLVIGVSKKGPVNTPIKLTTTGELEAIFGQLDRSLERKGSFFHRTISKMLETAPVYAVNLLVTDDNLDVIEYKSLSTSAGYKNDVLRTGPYRRFFDTTGFWKRDTESFINLTKNNTGYSERSINFTNLSDRAVSAFIFKSSKAGFDRTMIEWYGSIEKMPAYLKANDFASDYMVDVVLVAGDWSNYLNLSLDPRWNQYFNAAGLIKSQARNFANDRNITLLGYYEGLSLVPFFRDSNNKNIFIESVINADTDKTGVYCAFNNDLVEEDFYNGKLDLLGHTIADSNDSEIEFLSYKETISETLEFDQVPLDLPGNVTSLNAINGYDPHAYGSIPTTTATNSVSENRTGYFAEGVVYGVQFVTSSHASGTFSVSYLADADAYAVIDDKIVVVTPGAHTFSVAASKYSTAGTYKSVVKISNTGDITLVDNLTTNGTYPSIAVSDIALTSFVFTSNGTAFSSATTFEHITVRANGSGVNSYKGLTFNTDYTITNVTSTSVKVEFLDTANVADVKNYKQYRKFKAFNRLVDLIDNPNKDKMALIDMAGIKYTMADITISDIVTSSSANKSFVLSNIATGLNNALVNNGSIVLYTIDNEFILGSNGVKTKTALADINDLGVVGKYAELYTKFYDGYVNTGDYFYKNTITDANLSTLTFIDGEVVGVSPSTPYDGYNFLVSTTDLGLVYGDVVSVPTSTLNTGSFTVDYVYGSMAFGVAGTGYVYRVVEEVVYEELTLVDRVNKVNDKVYLEMYTDGTTLNVYFKDSELASTNSIVVTDDFKILVQSSKTNYKQTLEIEVPTGYTQVPNKILVSAARYTEVKVGDFIQADFSTSDLAVGEAPKKMTRILTKKLYTGDNTLVEITCDAPIKKTDYNGDLQTMRYLSVDNYATTYKAITMKGFKIRNASLPDGSEITQNKVLNLVAKGTPLFKALTNKEAFDFRYLIDSFGLGLTELSKQQLVDICGERLDCFGILNMPSMRQFKNSSSPSFVNSEGVLQAEFIAKGGNPESNPAFLYSFGEGKGTTCVAYFGPYVMVNDNGRPLEFPPASYVGTTFMRKHISNVSGVTPWTVAAGTTNGKITNITGLEIDFTPEDIEFLNQAQMNPIVYKRNRGYVIETENTAQTLYKSSLSYIHAREVLIELERELSRMLLDFQWKYNTPDVRAELKLRADTICETFVSKNGLYDYFNKCDDENNTQDLIDNQFGVLDTFVEIIKAMGVIVNQITILRTGQISSGGFN